MDYAYISLNNIYLILSFKNKNKTTFNCTKLIFAVAAEITLFNYINLIIYLIKNLLIKKNSLILNFLYLNIYLKLLIFS